MITKLHSMAQFFFDRVVLEYPRLVCLCVLVVVGFFSFQARHFRLDASAEKFVLDNDEDLRYTRLINSRYGNDDFLVLTYTPKEELFSQEALANLAKLRDELTFVKSIESVVSILDVPLLESPPVPLKELTANLPTLRSPAVDMDLARI